MGIRIIYEPLVLDEGCQASARAVIERYKKKGVLLAGALEDCILVGTNQLVRINLDFTIISEEQYRSNWMDFFGMPFDSFLMSVKCGVILKLGEAILPSLRGMIRDVAAFVRMRRKDLNEGDWALDLQQPYLFLDLLLKLPLPAEHRKERDWIVDEAENASYAPGPKTRRRLPDFKSILTFEQILLDFMKKATRLEKVLYFPLYLWWLICSVIPTRPIEFLVLPRDCLTQDVAGGWKLCMRKSGLKGRDKKVGYTIEEDFFEATFSISDKVASAVHEYQDLLESLGTSQPRIGTLLSPQLHYWALEKKEPWDGYYTYALFTQTLRMFFSEVVEGRYHYKCYYGHEAPPEVQGVDWTAFVRPGDARHIAMVNMAAEGVPLEVMMLLAGHSNPVQTVHYAGNWEQYERSSIHEAMSSSGQGMAAFTPLTEGTAPIRPGDPCLEIDDGYCYSPWMLQDDPLDCLPHVGPNEEMGWCPSCPYFRNSNPTLTITDFSHCIREVEDDFLVLQDTVDHYRMDFLGDMEGILRKVLKLQKSTNVLKRVLERNMKEKADEEG